MYRANRCIYTDLQISLKGDGNPQIWSSARKHEAVTLLFLKLKGHAAAEVKVAALIFFSSLFLSILLIFVKYSLECVKGSYIFSKERLNSILHSHLKYKMIPLRR